MTEPDPRRLLEEEPEGMLRNGLEVAREELPSEEQMASLAAKLGPLLGGGPGGGPAGDGGGGGAAGAAGATAGVAAKGTMLGKAAVALLAAGVVGGGVWVALDQGREQPEQPAPAPVGDATPPDDAPPTPLSPAESLAIPPPENPPGRLQDPEEDLSDRPRREQEERPGRAGRSAEQPPPGEVPLLEQAQDALAADPARALELVEEHRRHHPRGMLAQEREVLAIDALLRLGRRAEAEAQAGRFRERHPGSAQLRRIETLLAE